MEWENTDAICCVLSEHRSSSHFYKFANRYLQSRDELNTDYLEHPSNSDKVFETEHEMISCFADNPNLSALLYINGESEVLGERIMIGADFLSDGKTIYSITFPADRKFEFEVKRDLEDYLDSEISLMSYNQYPGYETANEFAIESLAQRQS